MSRLRWLKNWESQKTTEEELDACFKMMVVNATEMPNNSQATRYLELWSKMSKDKTSRKIDWKMLTKRKAYQGPQSICLQETDRRVCKFVTEKCN